MSDLVVTNASSIMTCDPARPGLGLVERGALVISGGNVVWVGPEREIPPDARALRAVDAEGGLVTPGLVDPHAHPIFAGDRAAEFAMRAAGRSYLEIAEAGGGIMTTVQATRAATDEQLLAGAHKRLRRALAWGTTTMEAKTGYALSIEGEIRLLRLLAELRTRQPVTLVPTLLAAHAVPPEWKHDRAVYVQSCAGAILERAQGLAHAVDVYCDEGAFTLEETNQILSAAQAQGFAVRAHAGQFRDLGAAGLVADLGGLSADHLEQVSDDQIARMARSGTVATLLAGACVQLRLPPPPIGKLRGAGVAIALGTDLNPGSSMSECLPVQMWLACTHLGLSVEEAWLGVTRHAARAAGRPTAGQLRPGAPGDALIWKATEPSVIPYHYAHNHLRKVIKAGTAIV
jgi:imidazolonepropionase